MTCLNDSHIQALADGEASPADLSHAAACVSCAERVRERERTMAAIRQSIDIPAVMPASLAGTVEDGFRLPGTRGGATRLRDVPTPRRWVYSGLAVAAATLGAVVFVTPIVKRPDATASAAEILAKSASQLSAVTAGIETLEYEMVLEGMPKEMLPDHENGRYTVSQAIDHNVPGRFRFATYAADGRMLTSLAEDPLQHRRVMAFSVEGQPYRFDVTLPSGPANMSLPEMQRLHMEATITMMRANGQQLLETVDGPAGRHYRIEVPGTSSAGTNPVWDLSEARVLIDARDYRVTEFAVRGTFLKQPYSMSYRLISHGVAVNLPADAFVVPAQPGEIVIDGEGTSVPTHDIVVLALRELTKMKQGR